MKSDVLRSALPLLVLVLVAAHQIRLARTTPLTPWKGGGFGMFSTTDSLAARDLRVIVAGPDRHREIEVPDHLAKLAARALALPDEVRLARLASAIAEAEEAAGSPVSTVEVEVTGTDYARETLFPVRRGLGRYRHLVAAGDAIAHAGG